MRVTTVNPCKNGTPWSRKLPFLTDLSEKGRTVTLVLAPQYQALRLCKVHKLDYISPKCLEILKQGNINQIKTKTNPCIQHNNDWEEKKNLHIAMRSLSLKSGITFKSINFKIL